MEDHRTGLNRVTLLGKERLALRAEFSLNDHMRLVLGVFNAVLSGPNWLTLGWSG